jgi:hypothetical protein
MDNNFKDLVEVEGRKIYQSNKHLRNLANVMEHPEFRAFYQDYMSDPDTLKTMITFMKVYEAIECRSNVELTPYQKIGLVQKAIQDSDLRGRICAGISRWMAGDMSALADEKRIV